MADAIVHPSAPLVSGANAPETGVVGSVGIARERVAAALSAAIGLRDPYTVGHMQRVADLACAIGSELGCSETEVSVLRIGACLHDIGKLHIPLEVLTSPAPLSPLEYDVLKQHAHAGRAVVGCVGFDRGVDDAVLQHHERLDGSGYPDGLRGTAIAFEARIVAVADVVEAMSSPRPYRAALGVPAALREIERGRGRLYDPDVVDVCLHLFFTTTFRF